MKKLPIAIIAGLLLTQIACSNKEYLNPSTISQSQAVSSPDGLMTLSNGLQYRYTTNGALSVLYARTAGAGLTTREEFVLNVGNLDEANLALGASNVSNINSVVRNLWTQSHLVRSNAELILANTGVVAEAGTKSGIVGYASIFRGLALGTLGLFFEQSPITTGDNVPFVPRVQVFKEAISTLESAATQVTAAPVSANFTGKVVPGIDIPNTIQALIARYALFSGDYDKALAATAKVDLTKKSVFNFDDNTRNPLFEVTFGNLNVFQPTNASLGLMGALAPDAADKRIGFLTRPSTNVAVAPVIATAFYTANSAPVPVYLPGEMLLIQAEAYARKGDLVNAVTALNKVLTKTAAQDAFGVGAGLPAYAGAQTADAILTEIYRNRQIELAYQGFRLEDSRRFNRPGPGAANAERNRNFFPYPLTERNNNTSTPADPAI
ncbi:RagB/SusD family nutrient uptake outer membrane protein [Spirosoma spitsbergense]|uniref:RagB/SusD family nutrient uptake outer membrane protein n=1 Tax=Spirosoma spitsbergense TaxID=431554 RepID=UPI000362D9F7|nr:RagB/SusD family nutrient uptake outer membrane protein [Spirosoma spitsbergense]